jgi:hypothetical protein
MSSQRKVILRLAFLLLLLLLLLYRLLMEGDMRLCYSWA